MYYSTVILAGLVQESAGECRMACMPEKCWIIKMPDRSVLQVGTSRIIKMLVVLLRYGQLSRIDNILRVHKCDVYRAGWPVLRINAG